MKNGSMQYFCKFYLILISFAPVRARNMPTNDQKFGFLEKCGSLEKCYNLNNVSIIIILQQDIKNN